MPQYSRQMALELAMVCRLTYEQYARGIADPGYDGSINPPPGYCQIASFTAPELFLLNQRMPLQLKNRFDPMELGRFDLADMGNLEKAAWGLKKVYFGFALAGNTGSGNVIIALRGTQDPYEWLMDASFIQIPLPMLGIKGGHLALAKAHFGFLLLYAFLAGQISRAATKIPEMQTCYVTGHSLGAVLAVLAALTLGVTTFPGGGLTGKVRMVNYGGPRVGDPGFTDLYNKFIPESYRVVNLADLVPMLPPAEIMGYRYRHIGDFSHVWSFLSQSGDIGKNHSLDTYIAALQLPGIVTNGLRTYPCSGV